jgi:uncharacterized membrane protein YphA (DoxX/SURF4 family)
MGILFKARGSNSIGLFLIRFVLGIYFLALGISQASNIEQYIVKVKTIGIINENFSYIFGFVTPFLLIIFGALYIMGFFTPTTSFVLSIIMLIKICFRGLFPTFGVPFNKDIIFLVCTLTTLFAGAGIFSFDVFLDKKKGRKIEITPSEKAVVTAEVISETKLPEEPITQEHTEIKPEEPKP